MRRAMLGAEFRQAIALYCREGIRLLTAAAQVTLTIPGRLGLIVY